MAREKARKSVAGEGSEYQRESDRRWVATLPYVDPSTGAPQRKVFYGWTLAEAVAKRDAARKLAYEARLSAQRAPLTADYLDEYIRTKGLTGAIAPATVVNYTKAAKLLRPFIGHIRLDKLTPGKVQHAYNELLQGGGHDGRPLSPKTVRICHGVLIGAIRQAKRQRRIVFGPTEGVTPPRPGRYEHKTLTPDGARRLFDCTRDDDLHALWVVLTLTGLRIGEALALRWDSLDLTSRTVTVTATVQRQKGNGIVFKDCKTKESRRTVALPPTAAEALRLHRTRQLEHRLSIGDLWRDHNLVFTSEVGTALDVSNTHHRFQRALAKAGLDHMRQHDLRHTMATWMIAAGENAKVVQMALGHASITTTMNTYGHVLPPLRQEAADRLEAIYQGRKSASA